MVINKKQHIEYFLFEIRKKYCGEHYRISRVFFFFFQIFCLKPTESMFLYKAGFGGVVLRADQF